MIDPCEVLPVLALALAIVLLPLLADKPPETRRGTTPSSQTPRIRERPNAMG